MPIISDDTNIINVKQRVETLLFTGPTNSTHSILDVTGLLNDELGEDPNLTYQLYIKRSGSTVKSYLYNNKGFTEETRSFNNQKIIVGPKETLYVFVESNINTRTLDFVVNSISENNPVVQKAGLTGHLNIKNSMGPSELYRNDSPLGIYEVGNLFLNTTANYSFKYEIWITDNEDVVLTGNQKEDADLHKLYTGTIGPKSSIVFPEILLPPLGRIYFRSFPLAGSSFTGTICFNSLVVGD